MNKAVIAQPDQIIEIQDSANSNLDDEDDLYRSEESIDLNQVSAKSNKTQRNLLEASSDGEEVDQAIKLNIMTKQGVREALEFQMRIFDFQYDFELDELCEESQIENAIPSLEEIYYYCKYIIITGRMEKEIPILCLIYLDRFTKKTGILINYSNWKRLTLISLILASKIWDDDSLENVHFPQVMSEITLKEISGLE